jgi:hypothetical protein
LQTGENRREDSFIEPSLSGWLCAIRAPFPMGVDFADLNHDGAVDFMVVDMLSREHHKRLEIGAPRRCGIQ